MATNKDLIIIIIILKAKNTAKPGDRALAKANDIESEIIQELIKVAEH